MKKSESINELGAALAKAQGQFTAAERDYTAKVATRKGGEYQFNYADLAAYLDVCRGPLSANGLAVIQEPVRDGNKARVTTLLVHASGQWIEFEPLELEVAFKEAGEAATPQEIGSAITYARRYSQSAALNMASEQDDDGNGASGNRADIGKRQPNPACPQCGTNENVIKGKAEFGGGWLCWKKPEQNKHGCGHKWHDAPAEANGHDLPPMKTGAEIDEAQKATHRKALAAISKAVSERDKEKLKRISAAIAKDLKDGNLSKTQETALVNELAVAADKIEAFDREPLPA